MRNKMEQRNYFNLCCLLAFALLFGIGCGGCGSGKVAKDFTANMTKETKKDPPKEVIVTPQNFDSIKQAHYIAHPEQTPQTLKRSAFGKEITFNIDPMHEGGEAWKMVWEEYVDKDYYMNRVCQLSPTVVLYRRYPSEVAKEFYFVDQPETIEFLDTTFKTIKTVDIWNNRPYKDIKNTRLTYHHFSSEGMEVIPYNKQEKSMKPTEYSLFTDVRSEGKHVIVNYELRSLETTKSFGIEETSSKIIGVKHTLHIYDLEGNLKYQLKDLPSVDGAVVSNNGEYMMYTFGGIALATANNPFGTIEREGWALMRLRDQKVVYQEYTDDGKLAFNRLWIDEGYLRLTYSTPNPNDGLAHSHIFFSDKVNLFYKKLWTNKEWALLNKEWKETENKSWKYYISKFNFQQIPIENR